MFITKKSYDAVNARNVELARQVRDLSEGNKCLHEENRDLRNENEEQHNIIRKVEALATSNTYNNAEVILRKILELARPGNQN